MPSSQPTLRPRRSRPLMAYALLVIDEEPLKRTAWSDLHAARKRQEKAARDLHRHEEVDRPAYEEWLHRTFPTFVTRLRELHEEVFAKGQRVQAVQAMAAYTGRSARKIWREQKEQEANPDLFEADEAAAHEDAQRDAFSDDDDFFGDDRSSRGRFGQD